MMHLSLTEKVGLVRSKMFSLVAKPQSFFGIPVNNISPSSWQSVITILKRMDVRVIPSDRILVICRSTYMLIIFHF